MKTRFLIITLFLFVSLTNADLKQQTWEKSYFIWNFGLITSCDIGCPVAIPKNPEAFFAPKAKFVNEDYRNIKPGNIVWIQCRYMPFFCKQVLPKLEVPIVLLISDDDASFPSDYGKNFDVYELLNNKNILHIFAQNYDRSVLHPKLSHLPIGIDYHTIAYKGADGKWGEKGSPLEQEAYLITMLQTLKPTHARKKRAYLDFQHFDSMREGGFKRYLQFGEDRTSIFNKIIATGLADYGPWVRRTKLWEIKGDYAFSVSPHGNGLDCHRTWEDLILGCIVIVKTSPLDPLYEGLPVVIVKDWSEITEENLEKWLALYGDAFNNPKYREKLTHLHWFSKIKAATVIN
jgi:hypothetical protein